MPSLEAMCLLTGMYHGDTVTVNPTGRLAIRLAKALEPPVKPGEYIENIVTDSVLDELECRGWIDVTTDPPTITQAGQYWLRRFADRTVGKRYQPAIRNPPIAEPSK